MAIFMGNNGSLGAVYAGRFIAGLGVGQTVVVAPVYLAEIVRSTTPIPPRRHEVRHHEVELQSNLNIRPLLLFEVSVPASSLVLSISVCCLSQESLTHPRLGALLVLSDQLSLTTSLLAGIVLAYFANYGCQVNLGDNTHNRWVRSYFSSSSSSSSPIPVDSR
jgi:hypothetical protein